AFADGTRAAAALLRIVRAAVEAEPLAVIDYVSLADSETLEEIEGPVERAALLSLAVRFSGTRLIDNVTLRP
ncbi:MAG: pantoate--beta-alanine ligase, partial [Chloroflexi bacterium]|nr:pantoate--beta-alanine ligase [Chloroflexota bacterium]